MGALDYLVSFNDFLERVPINALEFFKKMFKAGEEYTQDFVDACCRWIAWKINIMVERQRQKVIKQLADHYAGALAVAGSMNIFVKAVSDPLGTIGGVFNYFAKPIKIVKDFVKVLLKEIPRLANNLANIANSLPPDPPNPHINFNAFKLKIGTISLPEIMGVGAMPTPEEMFPAPPSPFSKAAFDSSFENAKSQKAEDKVLYKMSGGTETDGTAIA
jgi:hypothetical protein